MKIADFRSPGSQLFSLGGGWGGAEGQQPFPPKKRGTHPERDRGTLTYVRSGRSTYVANEGKKTHAHTARGGWTRNKQLSSGSTKRRRAATGENFGGPVGGYKKQ